jgi:uncharacterized protein
MEAPPGVAAGCVSGCTLRTTPLYLAPSLTLRFEAPESGDHVFEEYISDPAKPVPFRARPVRPIDYADANQTWPQWLADDQREASGRPDVVAFVSDVLTTAVKISGQPIAHLVASTSGTTLTGWSRSSMCIQTKWPANQLSAVTN